MSKQDQAEERIQSEEREKVEFLCRNCKACGGAGMAIVFHPQWSGSRFVTVTTERNGEVIQSQVPAEVAAHCYCELGVWMRGKTSLAMRMRIPDGEAILLGQSNWLFNQPGTVRDEYHEAPTRAAIARRFGKIPQNS